MPTELTAAEANRRFYRQTASAYDETEVCVFGPRQQRRFRDALRDALAHANPLPVALDACGGSGNASLALAEYDVRPVVVDVSAEMLEVWRSKAAARGFVSETHLQPIEDFLSRDPRCWDLITFCSALHHLEDYGRVMMLAAERLTPGGIIFTMYDPTKATHLTALLRKVDWLLHLGLTHPGEFLQKTWTVARRRSQADDPDAYVGRRAERHAYAGIDDLALVQRAREFGLEVLVHDRYVDARLPVVIAVLRSLGLPSHFHLVLQRPVPRR